jgi:hypothetical protein
LSTCRSAPLSLTRSAISRRCPVERASRSSFVTIRVSPSRGLVARIGHLAARGGGYRRMGPFLTPDPSPCHSKRTKIAAITSRSSGTG